jgi:hypothetical protein
VSAFDGVAQLTDQGAADRAGEGVPDRLEELLLEELVAGQHDPDDRRGQQEDREQCEEGEVRDAGRHQVALGPLVTAAGADQVVEPVVPAALGAEGVLDPRVGTGPPRFAAGGWPRRLGGRHRQSLRPARTARSTLQVSAADR